MEEKGEEKTESTIAGKTRGRKDAQFMTAGRSRRQQGYIDKTGSTCINYSRDRKDIGESIADRRMLLLGQVTKETSNEEYQVMKKPKGTNPRPATGKAKFPCRRR